MIDVLHPTATSNLVAIDIAKDCNVALMQETLSPEFQVREPMRGSRRVRSVSAFAFWTGADRTTTNGRLSGRSGTAPRGIRPGGSKVQRIDNGQIYRL
jgi:hypothetical protein